MTDFSLKVVKYRLGAELFQIRVLGQPGEIAITEQQGFFERQNGALKFLGERVTAGEIVKNQRVLRLKAREVFIHFEAFSEEAALGVVVAEQLERIHVIGIPADDPLDKLNLGIEVALAGAARLSFGLAFTRHTTKGIFPNFRSKSRLSWLVNFRNLSHNPDAEVERGGPDQILNTPRMKCFVTGASGFIGSNLVQELSARGHRVKALLRPAADERGLQGAKYDRVEGDILDRKLLGRELDGCDWCFHVAASYQLWMRNYKSMYETNVEGTRTVLEAAGKAGCRKIIHTSTVGCIGLPRKIDGKYTPTTEIDIIAPEQLSNDYKKSKFEAEAIAVELYRKQALPIVIVNPSAPIGPGDVKPTPTGRVIVDFLNRKMPAYLETGLNWVHVRDVAIGHILAAEKGDLGQRYILGNAEGNWTMQQTLGVLQELTGIPAPTLKIPYWFAYRVAEANEILSAITGKPPRAPIAGVRMAKYKMWFNPQRAIRDLGLPQTSPRQAFADAIAWFRANGYVKK